MVYKAENLPKGLVLDPNSGIITGKILERGEYDVTLHVFNTKGEDDRNLKIIVGDQLALTPPIGWNGYNSWCGAMNDSLVLEAARACIDKGLINHGWTYINLDDGWQAGRDANGEIQTNEKFKNIKALGDSIHKFGLKFGIHSSPGPLSCANFMGSYQHEFQDAKTYEKWGIDYLKYDWCSYDTIAKDRSLPELKKPYFLMQEALSELNRDIVYSLCQYGMGDVWQWGAEVGGNLWRTSFDITDTWKSVSEIGLAGHDNARFAGPGHWNDLDMMVVGWVGWGPDLHPTHLTIDEQYSHVSLWALLASPMILGCDLDRLDDFTMNLITNDEVLAVNQDLLGKQATLVFEENGIQIWAKDLNDGSKAAGIFNLNQDAQDFKLYLKDLGFNGKQIIRNVWRQKDIGEFEDVFATTVPSHGVVFINLRKMGSQKPVK
jgi:hypothetical protein